MEKETMTVSDLCGQLQSLAHEGYALHGVEILSECDHCSNDAVLDDPVLEIVKSEESHSVKLIFKNKKEE